ncbi:MAG: alkaline phosphatase D family protein [Myxococcota bacterium]
MRFSRREVIKGMGAAGLTPVLMTTASCGDGDDQAAGEPLPDLPEYSFDGTPGPENLFEHGVASGDPTASSVILWTRVSPASDGPVEVWWEMALDPSFEERTAQGTVTTDASRDYTAKIDATDLVWGRSYYYRFFAEGRESPTGRTRLAPAGDEVSRLRFGVCSCSNYSRGWFHAYRNMAQRADLDAVLHLGDYIYENGSGGGSLRQVEPDREILTLDDYRTRYSLYRRDADLQEVHRQFPFVVVWDDHETANNSWKDGAQNHTPGEEGAWSDRLAEARQAYFEWLPIRDNDGSQLFRRLQYGDLADLIMLDTRIEGREEQSTSALYPLGDPSLPDDILGPEQEAWLFEQLRSSTAQWKIVGNQVVMSIWQFNDEFVANEDQWTGYRGSRERLMTMLRDEAIENVVVVTGDVHSSWAMDVTVGDGSYDGATGEGAVGVEFVAPGITSPGGAIEPVAGAVLASSPHVRFFSSGENRGYFVLDLQPDKAQADWYFIDGVAQEQGAESEGGSYATMTGASRVMEMTGPELANDTTAPLVS